MFRLTETQQIEFADAVHAASRRDDLAGPLAAIYESVSDAVALQMPVCTASGACCKFDQYGHLLFVTTVELAAFLAAVGPAAAKSDEPCPYQIGGRCSVHGARPFGCRVFYCDPTAAEWQTEIYSRLHRQLRDVHDRFDVPYFYVEWRQALSALRLDNGVAAAPAVHLRY